jgi:hypothetical protein
MYGRDPFCSFYRPAHTRRAICAAEIKLNSKLAIRPWPRSRWLWPRSFRVPGESLPRLQPEAEKENVLQGGQMPHRHEDNFHSRSSIAYCRFDRARGPRHQLIEDSVSGAAQLVRRSTSLEAKLIWRVREALTHHYLPMILEGSSIGHVKMQSPLTNTSNKLIGPCRPVVFLDY